MMTMPLDLLEKSLNDRISMLLKDGRILEGKLSGYDTYMNMVLVDVDERQGDDVKKLGTVVLRGNNIVSISLLGEL
jgi:small nuclear ribonucleoprotein